MLNICINIEAFYGKKHGVDDLSQHKQLQNVKPPIVPNCSYPSNQISVPYM
jgi:hypothetical protein